MREVAIAAALGIVLVAAILIGYRQMQRREVSMVQSWAKENGMVLLNLRKRGFFESAPFSFWITHKTPNYFVNVRDPQGKERSGWVRLGTVLEGTYWGGKDKVEVRWVETS